MIINSSITLIANAYHVQVGLSTSDDALTEAEKLAISNFGEPVVDCGGSFSGGVTFELASNELRFPSQFPVKAVFDTTDDADAQDKAALFRSTIITRIDTAVTAKRDLSNAGQGRWEETIDTTP